MKYWENFEKECSEYLNINFWQYAKFTHQGGANSTISDILVQTKTGKNFYIEAKHSPAQCGQFVLLPNKASAKFEYSSKNTKKTNVYAEKIIDHMDANFDFFCEAGTSGRDIKFENDEEVFANWIIEMYKEKNVKFIITNDYDILPIEEFQKHFDIKATYRIKRSGSSSVGKGNIEEVAKHIISNGYGVSEKRVSKDKLFVSSKRELHNFKFMLGKDEYMFSKREKEYEVRKLSNTYNANVIFTIRKIAITGLTKDTFVDYLK